jgi:hypothetical protein
MASLKLLRHAGRRDSVPLTGLTLECLGGVVNWGLELHLQDVLRTCHEVIFGGKKVADEHVLGGAEKAAVQAHSGDCVHAMEIQLHYLASVFPTGQFFGRKTQKGSKKNLRPDFGQIFQKGPNS